MPMLGCNSEVLAFHIFLAFATRNGCNKGMETIDFAEKTVEASLKEARDSYDAIHERACKFATWTMGASGAVSIYAIGYDQS